MKYLVITTRTPNFQSEVIEHHYNFLDQLRLKNQLEIAGPFTDKSGGAYVITAKNLEEALEIAYQDPVHTTKSSTIKVHEWTAKQYQIPSVKIL